MSKTSFKEKDGFIAKFKKKKEQGLVEKITFPDEVIFSLISYYSISAKGGIK